MGSERRAFPAFGSVPDCPKCGGEFRTLYHDAAGWRSENACAAVRTLVTSYPPEHLCLSCTTCNYRTFTATKDEPDGE